jgi:hypothetical protein
MEAEMAGEAEDDSLFGRSLKVQEEALRMHKQTDERLTLTKRKILLNLLKQIKTAPPAFLTNSQNEHTLEELETTIAGLERLVSEPLV